MKYGAFLLLLACSCGRQPEESLPGTIGTGDTEENATPGATALELGKKMLRHLAATREYLLDRLKAADRSLAQTDRRTERLADALAAKHSVTDLWLIPRAVRDEDPGFRAFAESADALAQQHARRRDLVTHIRLVDKESAQIEEVLYAGYGWENPRREAWRRLLDVPADTHISDAAVDQVAAEHGEPNRQWRFYSPKLNHSPDRLGELRAYWRLEAEIDRLNAVNAELLQHTERLESELVDLRPGRRPGR